jgi:hypothetical protein
MRGTERWTQTNQPIENLRYPSRAYPRGMFTASAALPMRAIKAQGTSDAEAGTLIAVL